MENPLSSTAAKKKGKLKIINLPEETIEILARQAIKERRSVKGYLEMVLIQAAEKLLLNELSEK